METRELSSERHTESELDLGESVSPEPGSGPDQTRLPLGLSVRGLQGTAAVVGFIAIVTAAVIGGALAVDSVARGDGNRPDGSAALLNDGDFTALPPSPAAAHPKTDVTKPPKKDAAKPKATEAAKKNAAEGSGKKGSSTAKPTTPAGSAQTTAPRVREAAPLAEMGVIRNLTTGQCVDLPDTGVPAAGAATDEFTCTPGTDDNQDFQLVEQFGQVMIRNLKSNLCLDLPGTGRVAKSTVVTVGYCQAGDSDNQMFRAEAQGAGYYLVNVKSGLCLDVSGATDSERDKLGQPLTLFPCSPDDDHIWTVG